MKKFSFLIQTSLTFWVSLATLCAARPVVRGAALQFIGIARYSSSLRLAPHPTGHTAHSVQLPFPG